MSDDAGQAIDHALEEGSTNVYADLGYPDAEAMLRKSQIVSAMSHTIKTRRLTLETVAAVLQIDKSEVSRITRGQFRSISEAQLREWASNVQSTAR
jgi:predicted XRE-type DNA-binding protein